MTDVRLDYVVRHREMSKVEGLAVRQLKSSRLFVRVVAGIETLGS